MCWSNSESSSWGLSLCTMPLVQGGVLLSQLGWVQGAEHGLNSCCEQ